MDFSHDVAEDDEDDTRGSQLGQSLADGLHAGFEQGTQRAADRAQLVRDAFDETWNRATGTASAGTAGLPGSGTCPGAGFGKGVGQDALPSPAVPAGEQPPVGGTSPLGGASPVQDAGQAGSTGQIGSLGPNLDRWDPTILEEAQKWGVPPERIKAMMALESGGDPNALQVNPKYGNTAGLMQINAAIWGDQARNLGYDLNTPEGQIGMASWLLKQGYNERGSWDGATSWYFNPSGTGDSVNGTTNAQYLDIVHGYEAEMARNL